MYIYRQTSKLSRLGHRQTSKSLNAVLSFMALLGLVLKVANHMNEVLTSLNIQLQLLCFLLIFPLINIKPTNPNFVDKFNHTKPLGEIFARKYYI